MRGDLGTSLLSLAKPTLFIQQQQLAHLDKDQGTIGDLGWLRFVEPCLCWAAAPVQKSNYKLLVVFVVVVFVIVLVRSCLLITLIKCLKGHKSVELLLKVVLFSVVKTLIVSGVRGTNELSCSGQLKREFISQARNIIDNKEFL